MFVSQKFIKVKNNIKQYYCNKLQSATELNIFYNFITVNEFKTIVILTCLGNIHQKKMYIKNNNTYYLIQKSLHYQSASSKYNRKRELVTYNSQAGDKSQGCAA